MAHLYIASFRISFNTKALLVGMIYRIDSTKAILNRRSGEIPQGLRLFMSSFWLGILFLCDFWFALGSPIWLFGLASNRFLRRRFRLNSAQPVQSGS